MGWLLELLLDGIREICSQFIVDMMELVTEMFTELLSCNLSLFEELFSVVSALYKNVIVPMGIAILLLILIWQLFKSMFGKSVNGEEPIELLIRSVIALFFVVAAKPIVNYILKFAGTPYQWVVGTEIKVESFSGFVSALEGVTEALGIGKLSISLLMLIMQFVVAWNYFKMLFVIAERYVLLGVFSYTAPLAFSTGGSKSTNNILASWSKMFGGQVVLIILNAWCMKMFLSGYGNLMASSYGFTKFFVATLCLVGFCKITFKLDSYLASLGVNLGRPSAGMGAMGLIMAASRILSQIGRANAGDGSSGLSAGAETSGTSEGSGMTEGFAGPIPMMPGGGSGADMDMTDMPSESGFEESTESSGEGKDSGDFAYPSENPTGGGSVLEELGVVAAGGANETGTDSGIDMGTGTSIGGTGEASAEASSSQNLSGIDKDTGANMDVQEAGSEMDMNLAGIPEYDGPHEGEAPEAGEGAGTGEAVAGVSVENGYGNSSAGIISEVGDYPVEEEPFDDTGESPMELDGNTIDGMGSPASTEGVSYGNAGDAFGSTGLASRGGSPAGSRAADTGAGGAADAMSGIEPIGSPEGILSEMGADFQSGRIEPYGMAKPAGTGASESAGAEMGGALSDMELGENSGALSGMDFGESDGVHFGMGSGENGGVHSGIDSGEDGGMPLGMSSGENSGAYSGMDMEENGGMPFGMRSEENGDRLSGIGAEENLGMSAGREPEGDGAYSDMNPEGNGGILPGMEAVAGGTAMPETSFMREQGGTADETGRKTGGGSPYDAEGGSAGGLNAEGTSMENGVFEGISMPEGKGTQEKSEKGEALRDEASKRQDNSVFESEPIAEMEGQMSHMGTGQAIPSGSQKGSGRRKHAREFREVPKTREELRRRQQNRSEQKPTDGSPFA